MMLDGKISEIGSYKELLTHNGAFAQFLKNYLVEELQKENADGKSFFKVFACQCHLLITITNSLDPGQAG